MHKSASSHTNQDMNASTELDFDGIGNRKRKVERKTTKATKKWNRQNSILLLIQRVLGCSSATRTLIHMFHDIWLRRNCAFHISLIIWFATRLRYPPMMTAKSAACAEGDFMDAEHTNTDEICKWISFFNWSIRIAQLPAIYHICSGFRRVRTRRHSWACNRSNELPFPSSKCTAMDIFNSIRRRDRNSIAIMAYEDRNDNFYRW